MALKPFYVLDGQRWLPIARAAALLGTNPATVKRWMGDGTLEWRQLRTNSKSLLASERDVLRLRGERKVVQRETEKRVTSATRSAAQAGRSQLYRAPASAGRPGFDVFTRTWDPAMQPLPVSGRDKPDPNRP
jgi:hypothetical protein